MFNFEFLLRLLLAAAAGAGVGVERELRGHVAGVRTHSLVAVGAALFSLSGVAGTEGAVSADPTRLAAQVVSGIGFIGAGAILRDGGGVRGLTTASTIWVSGALGVGAAVGELFVALGGVIIVLLILSSRKPLRWLFRSAARSIDLLIEVDYDIGHGTIGPLIRAASDTESDIVELRLDDDTSTAPPRRSAILSLRIPKPELSVLTEALDTLEQRSEVHSLRFEKSESSRPNFLN